MYPIIQRDRLAKRPGYAVFVHFEAELQDAYAKKRVLNHVPQLRSKPDLLDRLVCHQLQGGRVGLKRLVRRTDKYAGPLRRELHPVDHHRHFEQIDGDVRLGRVPRVAVMEAGKLLDRFVPVPPERR